MSELFTKKQLDKLLNSDSISEREKLIALLESRVDYIVREAFFKTSGTDGWWSWEYYEDDRIDPPSFDQFNISGNTLDLCICPDSHRVVAYLFEDKEWLMYDCGIPLSLLWTPDVVNVIKKCYEEWKEKEESRAAKAKVRKKELDEAKKKLRASAMEKLTEEEKWACGLSKAFPYSLREKE